MKEEQYSNDTLHLMKTARFLPLFITQFITSFNDNFFKNALVALVTFGIMTLHFSEAQQESLVFFAGIAFILPYFLFSATAGKIADKYERTYIVRIIKICEIILMLIGAIGFSLNNIYILFFILFCMGIHSAFFSPVKFGILPTYLRKNELIAGNALLEAGTFLAIVMGIIAGNQITLIEPLGHYIAAGCMIVLALIGYYACLFMPKTQPISQKITLDGNILKDTFEIIGEMKALKEVTTYILASGWFWFVASVLVTIFPLYVKDILRLNEDVYTLILVVFAIGVGLGSGLCSFFLKGSITARHTPVAAILMGLFAIDLGLISGALYHGEGLGTLQDFLNHPSGMRILFNFTAISAAGGFYVVPFFSLVQDKSPAEKKSRMIGGTNIVNALCMVMGVAYCALLTKIFHWNIDKLLILTGFLCLFGSMVIHRTTPDSIFPFWRRAKPVWE